MARTPKPKPEITITNIEVIQPLLYIAAPYTVPDPVLNTNAVLRAATVIAENTKWVPFIPHLTLLWHAVTPRPYEFWMELDRHYMFACRGFVRFPGESSGADREMERAVRRHMEIVEFDWLPIEAQSIWKERDYGEP